MKKNLILSILMLSVLLVSVGMVSAYDILFEDDFDSSYTEFSGADLYAEMNVVGWNIFDNTHPDAYDDFWRSDDSPTDGYYLVMRDDSYIITSINTEGYKNIELEYERRTKSIQWYEYDYIETFWRIGNSGSWTLIESIYGNNWGTKSFSFPSSADDQSEIQIKVFLNNGNGDYGFLDNVEVTGDVLDNTAPSVSMDAEPDYPMCTDDVTVCATVTDDSAISFVDITCTVDDTTIIKSNVVSSGDEYCAIFSASTMTPLDADDLECTVEAEDEHENNVVTDDEILATYDCADPVADANGDYSCDEGNPITLSSAGSYDSASGIASYFWSVSGSDATLDNPNVANPTLQCLDGDNSPTVTLTVTDNIGLTGTDTAIVNIANVAPDADAHGPYPVNEGASVTLSGSATDVAADSPITIYEWDLTGGSSYTTVGQNPSFSCSQDGTYTVKLRATDKDGGMGYDTATVNCANVAPVIDSLGVSPNPIDEEESTTLTALVSDVGADDTTLNYVINWGDGSSDTTDSTSDGTISETHQYMDDDGDDMYTVTLTVEDSDHATDVDTTTITVLNLDPWNVDAGEDQSVVEGESVCFSGSAEDVAADTPLTYTWDFGDSSGTVTGQTPCHSYSDDGVYTVTMTVEDDDGGSATDTLTVYVYDYVIPLDAGWNLISIPLVPEGDDTLVSNVFGSIADDVIVIWAYTYDSDSGQNEWTYHEVVDGEFDSGDDLQNIVPGYGYYIKMEYEAELYLNGEIDYQVGGEDNDPVMGMPPSVTLAMDSWNLIGVYGLDDTDKHHALKSLKDQDGDKYYDILYDEDGHHPDSTLESLEGYWLSIKKAFACSDTIQYKANYQQQQS